MARAYEPELFYPTALPSLPDLMTTWGYTPRQIEDHEDKFAYILHLVTTLPHLLPSENGYASLHFDNLVRMLGARYARPFLDQLIDAGIIECDGRYSKSRKSFGYRICAVHHSRTVACLTMGTTLRKKLIARHESEQRQLVSGTILSRMHQDLQQLRVRYEEARLENQQVYDATHAFLVQHRARLDTTTLVPADYRALLVEAQPLPGVRLKTLKAMRKSARSQRCTDTKFGTRTTLFSILARMCLDRLDGNANLLRKIHERRIPQPSRPVAGSRIYSVVTSLSSWLRPYLYRAREEHQALYNLDISNSQPFLLSILLREKYGTQLPADAQRYIDLTCAGTFYKTIAGAMGEPYATKLEQKAFKEMFFASIFFCETLHTRNSRAGAYFREHFPVVTALIEQHKSPRYQALAIRMQQVEAEIIVDTVAAALQRKRIWCATIHDSIVCLAQDKDEVLQRTQDAFRAAYELTPAVSVEKLEPEDQPSSHAQAA
ncbi:hypothetical protein [Hymenobacter jejuensis]|uniref:DNA-directed DNA polymerase family A palm domain-containing protein n=1 Tax=Hymenobacter jejuensis TaxID=2502781 RepID=A0A5B7ZUZ2_9BACT|nr:hypothetical protein [Hymenobacter jejuensis]QDA59014.1 hypothetical protein FHG12_02360 [Hymenobacter jejuensis]